MDRRTELRTERHADVESEIVVKKCDNVQGIKECEIHVAPVTQH